MRQAQWHGRFTLRCIIKDLHIVAASTDLLHEARQATKVVPRSTTSHALVYVELATMGNKILFVCCVLATAPPALFQQTSVLDACEKGSSSIYSCLLGVARLC